MDVMTIISVMLISVIGMAITCLFSMLGLGKLFITAMMIIATAVLVYRGVKKHKSNHSGGGEMGLVGLLVILVISAIGVAMLAMTLSLIGSKHVFLIPVLLIAAIALIFKKSIKHIKAEQDELDEQCYIASMDQEEVEVKHNVKSEFCEIAESKQSEKDKLFNSMIEQLEYCTFDIKNKKAREKLETIIKKLNKLKIMNLNHNNVSQEYVNRLSSFYIPTICESVKRIADSGYNIENRQDTWKLIINMFDSVIETLNTEICRVEDSINSDLEALNKTVTNIARLKGDIVENELETKQCEVRTLP